jgi:hypothetical protein
MIGASRVLSLRVSDEGPCHAAGAAIHQKSTTNPAPNVTAGRLARLAPATVWPTICDAERHVSTWIERR